MGVPKIPGKRLRGFPWMNSSDLTNLVSTFPFAEEETEA